jgi:ankyrin repeat protein
MGLSINSLTVNKSSLLHVACYEGNLDIARYLLKNNFDVNLKDSYNHSPLHLAVFSESYKLVKYLLIKGAKRNSINN